MCKYGAGGEVGGGEEGKGAGAGLGTGSWIAELQVPKQGLGKTAARGAHLRVLGLETATGLHQDLGGAKASGFPHRQVPVGQAAVLQDRTLSQHRLQAKHLPWTGLLSG